MKVIKLTDYRDGRPILINTRFIIAIYRHDSGRGIATHVRTEEIVDIYVKETVQEVYDIINAPRSSG